MADFNWSDHPEAPAESFNWDDHPVDSKTTELQSLGRGLAQGASFGLRDEGAGAITSPSGALKEIANKFGAHFSDEDIEAYRRERDASRQMDQEAKAANPKSYLGGELGGAVATAFVPGLGLAKGAGLAELVGQGALQGAAYGLGGSQGESIGDLARDTSLGAVTGAAGGAVGHYGGQLVSKAVQGAGDLAGRFAPSLAKKAENLALNATGATGMQSAKFAPGSGRELLDRGLVRFADSPANIAGRVAQASDEAGAGIGAALQELDQKGVTASVENVTKSIEQKIKDLNRVPGNEKIIRQLQGELDNLYERGQSVLPVSEGEIAKRNFQKQTNYASPEAEKTATGEVANSFRNEVERAAMEADPTIGAKFKDDKKLYGLLEPIQEAAEKRANTLRQSPHGGLGDVVAAGAAGIKGVVAKKVLFPRIASSMAVTVDSLAKMAKQSPQIFGSLAGVMKGAAERGSQAIAATHFILGQSNPEYQKIMQNLNGQGEQNEQ